MIDFDEMAKAHERLFPKADLASQIYKLEEEIGEYRDARGNKENMKKELADIGIVSIGIYRFAPRTAMLVFTACARQYGAFSDLSDAIKEKWAINEARKWEWNGKTYHHVED